jgi:hypothetical protein
MGESMPNKVLRREDRHKFRRQPEGRLTIHVAGECIPVPTVRDVSLNGMSVVIDSNEVEIGVVTIEYKSHSIDIKVEGAVIWKVKEERDANRPQYVLGIELIGSSMLLTSLMGN